MARLGTRSSWAGQWAIQTDPARRPPNAWAIISAVTGHLRTVLAPSGWSCALADDTRDGVGHLSCPGGRAPSPGSREPALVVQSRRRHWGRSSVTPSARAGRGGCARSVATGHRACPSSLAPPLVVRHGSRMGPACRALRRPRPVSAHAPCGAVPRTGHATASTASRRGIVASRCIGCRRSPGHCTAMRALLTTGCRPAADFETCHQGA